MPSRAKEVAAYEPAGPPPITRTVQLFGTAMFKQHTIIDRKLLCKMKKNRVTATYCQVYIAPDEH